MLNLCGQARELCDQAGNPFGLGAPLAQRAPVDGALAEREAVEFDGGYAEVLARSP
ncbi:MAG: hypothetical protein ACRDRL_11350 [Sciscionella sp.]